MEIEFTVINGCTAQITYCGANFVICYWDRFRDCITSEQIVNTGDVLSLIPKQRELLWIKVSETGKSYNTGGEFTPVAHLIPLFRYICEANASEFTAKIISLHKLLRSSRKK